MTRALAAGAVLALSSAAAQAELLYGDWIQLRSADPVAADRLLNAVGDSLQWANAVLRIEDKPRLYCPPPGTEIGLADYRSLLDAAVAATGADNARTVDVPILLLRGLREAFECAARGQSV